MVEGWPRRALSPSPQSSSPLASSWKSISPGHSYEMRGFLPASAATCVRQPCWSAGGQNHGQRGLALGLPRSYGLERGAILELSAMSTKCPISNCDFSSAIGHGRIVGRLVPAILWWWCFGALVLCIKSTSSLPVLQIPILHYEINYG